MTYRNVIDYNIDHIFDLNVDFDKYPICQGNMIDLHMIFESGITKTIVNDDGKAIAVISILIMHEGVACVFIVPSKEAHAANMKTFVSSVSTLCKEELCNIVEENKLRRIETLTMDEKKHNRWMEYLGFSQDGTKKAYGINGEDFIMWSKLWV